MVCLSRIFERRSNRRKKLLGTIHLHVKTERQYVNTAGTSVAIGGRIGQMREISRKIRARGMFQEAMLFRQEHRRVID